MKRRFKLMLFVGIFIVLALVLSACKPTTTEAPSVETEAPAKTEEVTTAAKEPVTVTYWHTMSDPETAQLEKVVEAFEAENPNITIETTRYA
ncbi:MAG: hypothetical protein J7L73_02315, partial [Anaerolineales bacterium]|nr:hypothetical protein [Anaerolineales bacterium]